MRQAYLGALLSVGGNISINTGTNLIKLGQGTDWKNQPGNLQLLVGWVLFVFGNGVNFIALSLAPQTLLGSLGSVQFVANLVFLGLYLGEQIRLRNIFGTLLVVAGNTVLIFGFSTTQRTDFSVNDLYMKYLRVEYQLYVIATVVIYLLMQRFIYFDPTRGQQTHDFEEEDPLWSRTTHERSKLDMVIRGLSFSATSAMLGTESLVTGKTLAVILKNYSVGEVRFFDPIDKFTITFFAAVFTAWFVTMLFWMWRLSLSLVLFDAMFIIPVNQIMWIFFSVVSGGIYFQEFESVSPSDLLLLVIGLICVFIGVGFLVPENTMSASEPNCQEATPNTKPIELTSMEAASKAVQSLAQGPKKLKDEPPSNDYDASESEGEDEMRRLLKTSSAGNVTRQRGAQKLTHKTPT